MEGAWRMDGDNYDRSGWSKNSQVFSHFIRYSIDPRAASFPPLPSPHHGVRLSQEPLPLLPGPAGTPAAAEQGSPSVVLTAAQAPGAGIHIA